MGEVYYYFYKNNTEGEVDLTTNFGTGYKNSAPGAAYIGKLDVNANPTNYYILQNSSGRRIYAWEQPAIDLSAITFKNNNKFYGVSHNSCIQLINIVFSRRPYTNESFTVTVKYYAASGDLGDIEDGTQVSSYSTTVDRDSLDTVVLTPGSREYLRYSFSENNSYDCSYIDGVTRALNIKIHKNGFPDATDYNLWIGNIYSDDYFGFNSSGNYRYGTSTKVITPYTNYTSFSIPISITEDTSGTMGYIGYRPDSNAYNVNNSYESYVA